MSDTQKRRISRIFLFMVLAPVIGVMLFCATHAYVIYARNRSVDASYFPPMASPAAGQSLLIISPHPDDESLGAAGLVQAALRSHIPVHIVFLTDGDAFRVGVARYYNKLHVKPSDYVRYGRMREGEARTALTSLGVMPDQITFLGYPDQGLLPIWRYHWLPQDAYTSPYSRLSNVTYSDAYDPGATFCGISIVSDLKSLITKYHPTDIYTTHPSDDHPDHSAAPAFLNVALEQLQSNGQAWARGVNVHYFLVHRGDWPVPQGYNDRVALAPPAQMAHLDTVWNSFHMGYSDTVRKGVAIGSYASQKEMMGRFLNSFIRPNELFGELANFKQSIPIVSPVQINLDGDPRDWPAFRPAIIDPTGDTVLRDFQSSGDLQNVYTCTDGKNVYFRIETKSDLSEQVHYNLYLRLVGQNGSSTDKSMLVSFCSRDLSPGSQTALGSGVFAAYSGHTLEESIPISSFGAARPAGIYFEVSSMFSKLIIDRTGIREGVMPVIGEKQVFPKPLS